MPHAGLAFLFLAAEYLAMKSALLLLLLCGTAFCASYPVAQFVPPNSTYALAQFPYANQTAQVLVLNKSVLYAIFVPVNATLAPLTDKAALQSALYAYYSYLGYSPDPSGAFAAVHEGIIATKGSRAPGEADCRRVLGTDTHPCTDFDSCQKACYSVTSFCQEVALGAGSDFVNAIWGFENGSRLLDAAYGNESSSFAAFEANSSQQDAVAYLASLQAINVAATSASSNQLFSGYSYCAEPDYNLSGITAMELAAQNAFANASYFSSLPLYADALRNSTLVGLARQAASLPAKAPSAAPANHSVQNGSAAKQNISDAGAAAQAPLFSPFLAAAGFLLVLALAAAAWLAFGRDRRGLLGSNRRSPFGRKRKGL